MAITSSAVSVENPQIDGRRWVAEAHSDAVGVCARLSYLGQSDATSTAQGIANARAALLDAQLADAECLDRVQIDATPLPLRFQTAAQFVDRLRSFYRSLDREDLARLARWVTRRIDDGTVTVAQLRNAWGLTVGEWATLESKMRTLRAQIEAIDAAVGE